MIEFASASTRMINSRRAVAECLEAAHGTDPVDLEGGVIAIHASIGHNYHELADEARRLAPGARVVGNSCCGIVGSEGVSESMKDVAIMTMRSDPGEIAVAAVDGVYGANSFESCVALAEQLKAQSGDIGMVYFMAPGIDIAHDQCIAGLESVLGSETTIFGGASSDNMKAVGNFQIHDDQVTEHGAWAVGFADPTLRVETQARHGFVAVGDPLVVTKSSGHVIRELNGQPAWREFTHRLGLREDATCGDSIPIGALAEELSPGDAVAYNSPHILRVVIKREPSGAMHYTTHCPEGTRLWLTKRDEEFIFDSLGLMMEDLSRRAPAPVAVFHADCLARGRYLLNRVMKEEIVANMQDPLSRDGEVPPWLGMYGFGEFARLGDRNEYHNYTTSIAVLHRG